MAKDSDRKKLLEETQVFTLSEVAAIFGKKKWWAYKQAANGVFKVLDIPGETLVPVSEVRRLLNKKTTYSGKRETANVE